MGRARHLQLPGPDRRQRERERPAVVPVQRAEPYSDGASFSNPSASVDGGYCVYQSPSPYQGDYTANIYDENNTPQTCFTPCTAIFGCPPVTPTYNQFVEWGDADVNDQLFNNSAFTTDVNAIAVSGSLQGLATVGWWPPAWAPASLSGRELGRLCVPDLRFPLRQSHAVQERFQPAGH